MSNPYDALPQVPSFTLTSDDVINGETLKSAQVGAGVGGDGRSPQLAWSDFPAETRSFAVTTYDPDAPTASGYWHWAVYNIPVSVTSLEAGAGNISSGGAGLPEGAVALVNDSLGRDFVGAAPPVGHKPHHYYFVVHALDVDRLDLPEHATPAVLGFNLFSHTLARATLVGVYQR